LEIGLSRNVIEGAYKYLKDGTSVAIWQYCIVDGKMELG
jgi:hypothetical protein